MRLSVLNWVSSLVVGVCTFATLASCETIVTPGNVSGNWTIQGSPYIVSGGNITVPDGQRLKIEAGVRVEFRSHHKFVVQGNLVAGGLEADSVVFTYTGPDSFPGWRGFRLLSADSVRFNYCRFERGSAKFGSGSDSTGGVMLLSGTSNAEFRHCEFTSNYAGSSGGALYAGPGTTAKCYDCVFHDNFAKGDGGAMFANSAHGSVFARCEFYSNDSDKGGGAIFNRYANASYIDCYVHDNVARSSGGSLVVTGPPSFRRCVFENNVTLIAQGGGAYIYDSTTTATFDSCQFLYNRSQLRDGGGVYCWESPPRFTDCQFIGNFSSDDGGGVHAYRSGANPVFLRCLFERNEASDDGGGLIISRYSRAVLTDCIVRNNTSLGRGGGGIYFQLLCEPLITNCIIEGNSAFFGGGGLHINTGSPTLRDCSIQGNWTDSTGGGVFAEGATFWMERCTISENWAVDHGGGFGLRMSSPILSQCRIEDNHADSLGGGLYLLDSHPQITNCLITGNDAGHRGGALYTELCHPVIQHCTLARGRATEGHMLYSVASNGELIACILDNSGTTSPGGQPPYGLGVQISGEPWQIRNSLFHALGQPEYSGLLPAGFGYLSGLTAAGDSCDGYGNLFTTPGFAGSGAEPFSLSESAIPSAAVNAAPPLTVNTDLLGHPRNTAETDLPDIGCFEADRHESSNGLWGVQTGEIGAGDYRVFGDIIVPVGERLILQAGARLNFVGPFAVIVLGSFETQGTAADSVILTTDMSANLLGWRGIRFGSSDSASTLNHTVLENCRVTASDSSGGGLGIHGNSVELADCVVRGCISTGSGGGVKVSTGQLLMRRSVIEECEGLSGGGIYVRSGQTAQLDSCDVRSCNAATGGGLSAEGGWVSVSNSRFRNNTALEGAALHLRNSDATLADLEIAENSATVTGGGIQIVGSSVVADCLRVLSNSATIGGGVFSERATLMVSRANVSLNGGTEEGGGLYLDQCTGNISRSVVAGNTSLRGAGMLLVHDSTSFTRCTIDGNSGEEGSGVYLEDAYTHVSTSQVTNNDQGFYFANSAASVIEYCNLFSNRVEDFAYLSSDSANGPPGIGVDGPRNRLGFRCDIYNNTHEDPGYESPEEGTYQLASESPCVDAGSPQEPCDDDLTYSDIGAYHTPMVLNTWIPQNLTTAIDENGNMHLFWQRPDGDRLCDASDLTFQIEITDSTGEWQAVGLTTDTTAVLTLDWSSSSTQLVRVRSVIIE